MPREARFLSNIQQLLPNQTARISPPTNEPFRKEVGIRHANRQEERLAPLTVASKWIEYDIGSRLNFRYMISASENSQRTRIAEMSFDGLTLYGLVSVVLMLVFYSLEGRAAIFVLLFAISCVLASIYGFLQGAWPFGIVESIWSLVAVRRWWLRRAAERDSTWF